MQGLGLGGLAAGVLAAVGAWMADRRRRGYADRPTTPAAAVFAGRNEVKGRAATTSPLVSHRASVPCVWWDYVLEEERQHTRTVTDTESQGRRSTRTETYEEWHEVDRKDGSLAAFEVVDATGSVAVRLAGAKVVPRTVHRDVFRDEGGRGFLEQVFDNRTGRYRETETVVGVGDPLFVVGDAVLDQATCVPVLAEEVLVSTRSEESHTSRLGWLVGVLVVLAAAGTVVGTAALIAPDEPTAPSAWLPGAGGVLVLLALAWTATTYNRLRLVAEGAERAWSLIDVQLQRRHDLIPALVATVEAHAAHERTVLATVSGGRWVAGAQPTADAVAGEARAQGEQLRQVFAVAERYPVLGADDAFRRLQAGVADAETRIAASRTFYNDSVQLVRDRTRQFPGLLVARWLPVRRRELLAAEAFQRTAPAIAGPDGLATTGDTAVPPA